MFVLSLSGRPGHGRAGTDPVPALLEALADLDLPRAPERTAAPAPRGRPAPPEAPLQTRLAPPGAGGRPAGPGGGAWRGPRPPPAGETARPRAAPAGPPPR